ncbi:MAG: hypothetical protein K8H87_13885 [Pseudorhodoplanes sp.]|nr:hypothetical protein [Pseudorhodoplanes sp.]
MAVRFLRSLFGSRDLSDDDVLDAYGALLEAAELFEPISKLPAPKARIKAAIVSRAKVATDSERNDLLVAYLALAKFQDTSLAGVSAHDLQQAKDNSDPVEAVLALGPKIKAVSVLTELVNFERKVLAEEWEQAEVARILTSPIAHA